LEIAVNKRVVRKNNFKNVPERGLQAIVYPAIALVVLETNVIPTIVNSAKLRVVHPLLAPASPGLVPGQSVETISLKLASSVMMETPTIPMRAKTTARCRFAETVSLRPVLEKNVMIKTAMTWTHAKTTVL
jgi:hypothetical protein